jgi:tetratricopeptide (TPR) repeat protein
MLLAVPPRLRRPLAAASVALCAGLASCEALPPPDALDPEAKHEDIDAKKKYYEEAAQTYYDGGKYLQSVQQWRKVLEIEPERQKAKWGLAKSLAMVGTPETLRESEHIFEKIVDLDWSHPTLGDRRHEVLKDFADVYSSLADFYNQDITLLEKKLKQPDADAVTLRQQIETQTSTRNELLHKAIPLYEKALARSPDNPYAIGGLAKAYLLVGDDRRGIDYARRYIAISQRSQNEYVRQLDEQRKERGTVPTDMEKFYKDRIRGGRDKELKIHLLLGSVLVRNRDFDGAVAEYDRVLELDPAVPAAYLERGQAYALKGDFERAVADIEQFLKVTDPVSQRADRINAGELLQTYRAALIARPRAATGRAAAPATSRTSSPPPPPPPPAPMPTRR